MNTINVEVPTNQVITNIQITDITGIIIQLSPIKEKSNKWTFNSLNHRGVYLLNISTNAHLHKSRILIK